jgi:hypothetical protein
LFNRFFNQLLDYSITQLPDSVSGRPHRCGDDLDEYDQRSSDEQLPAIEHEHGEPSGGRAFGNGCTGGMLRGAVGSWHRVAHRCARPVSQESARDVQRKITPLAET